MILLLLAYIWLICAYNNWCLHTPTDIQKGWYAGVIIPLSTGNYCHFIDCLYLCHLCNNFAYTSQLLILCLYTSYGFLSILVITLLVYTSHKSIVYTTHQRPRGGERLAGRYSADELLRRLLRAGRCAGRVWSVGTTREGRGSSR